MPSELEVDAEVLVVWCGSCGLGAGDRAWNARGARTGVLIAELYKAGLTLVRPDQHVAWRGAHWSPVLHHAVGWLDGDRPQVSE